MRRYVGPTLLLAFAVILTFAQATIGPAELRVTAFLTGLGMYLAGSIWWARRACGPNTRLVPDGLLAFLPALPVLILRLQVPAYDDNGAFAGTLALILIVAIGAAAPAILMLRTWAGRTQSDRR